MDSMNIFYCSGDYLNDSTSLFDPSKPPVFDEDGIFDSLDNKTDLEPSQIFHEGISVRICLVRMDLGDEVVMNPQWDKLGRDLPGNNDQCLSSVKGRKDMVLSLDVTPTACLKLDDGRILFASVRKGRPEPGEQHHGKLRGSWVFDPGICRLLIG